MPLISILLVLGVVVFSFYFMVRPAMGRRVAGAGKKHAPARWKANGHEIALEIAVLTSMLINFPYGLFGLSSLAVLIVLAFALALLPEIARPAIAALMLVLGITRLEPAMIMRLFLVLAAFVAVRLAWRLFRNPA